MSFFEFPHTRTYDSDLGWLIRTVHTHEELIEALNKWVEENDPKIEDLMKFMKDMQDADTIPESVKEALFEWASEHLVDLVGASIKSVFFGLNDDGHFVAYIPDSWSDITFNTTYYDIILEAHPEVEYGHLVLSY